MKSFELIPYLFLSLPLLVGCSSSSRKATYPKELDYSEHYIESRVESIYGVTFVADGVHFMVSLILGLIELLLLASNIKIGRTYSRKFIYEMHMTLLCTGMSWSFKISFGKMSISKG